MTEQRPTGVYVELQTGLRDEMAYLRPTITILERVGFSRAAARRLMKERRMADATLIDFLNAPVDYLVIGKNQAIAFRPRQTTMLDRLRLWLCRRGLDTNWILPAGGEL